MGVLDINPKVISDLLGDFGTARIEGLSILESRAVSEV